MCQTWLFIISLNLIIFSNEFILNFIREIGSWRKIKKPYFSLNALHLVCNRIIGGSDMDFICYQLPESFWIRNSNTLVVGNRFRFNMFDFDFVNFVHDITIKFTNQSYSICFVHFMFYAFHKLASFKWKKLPRIFRIMAFIWHIIWNGCLCMEHFNIYVVDVQFVYSVCLLFINFFVIFDIFRNFFFLVGYCSSHNDGSWILFELRCTKNGERWYLRLWRWRSMDWCCKNLGRRGFSIL